MTCRHEDALSVCVVCPDADRVPYTDIVTAQRPGTCHECGEPIDVGEEIVAGDGEDPTVHARCAGVDE